MTELSRDNLRDFLDFHLGIDLSWERVSDCVGVAFCIYLTVYFNLPCAVCFWRCFMITVRLHLPTLRPRSQRIYLHRFNR